MRLLIWDSEKEVANTLEELREYFSTMGGKELTKAGDVKSPTLVRAVDENGKTYWFEFPENKIKKLIKTIMPSLLRKGKEEELSDDSE